MGTYLRRRLKHIEVRGGTADIRYEARPDENVQTETIIIEADEHWNEYTVKQGLFQRVLRLDGPNGSASSSPSHYGSVSNHITNATGPVVQAGHIARGGVTIDKASGDIQVTAEHTRGVTIRLRKGTNLQVKQL